MLLQLQVDGYTVSMEDSSPYAAGVAQDTVGFQREYCLGKMDFQASSRHILRVLKVDSEIASCMLQATGGASGVHEHSMLIDQRSCIVAVGPYLCSLALPSLDLEWQVQVDWATCFGVYRSQRHRCYLSHGEMGIACVSYSGELRWSNGGKDIFTGCFELKDDHIEVADFNGDVYRIEISSGAICLVAS